MDSSSTELPGLKAKLDRLVDAHMTHCECRASGSFHGTDSDGRRIRVTIPEFVLRIPTEADGKEVDPCN